MINFGSFNFVNVKPARVRLYLKFLAKASMEQQRKGQVRRVEVEDPRIRDIRKAEERFEDEVTERIEQIDKKISKTLNRLQHRLQEEKKQLEVEKSKQPKGRGLPPVPQNNVRIAQVERTSQVLADILRLKQSVRRVEERISWLHKRGYDSASIARLEARLHTIKDRLYTKIFQTMDGLAGPRS